MGNILYLVHRLPFPPNKGDKVRSYHLLKHLATRHRVYLGTFIDDPEDVQHIDALKSLCAEIQVVRLRPRLAKLRSLRGLVTGTALTEPYYTDRAMQRWVDRVVAQNRIESVVVFSAAMAQYVDPNWDIPILIDFVDVDSAKWAQYAPTHRWPLSWLYQRESVRLLVLERLLAERAARSFFVTEKEAALFRQLAPESSSRVAAMNNGVDADYFSSEPSRKSPFDTNDIAPIVFTGAMDYWPNIDAVTWFATEVLPIVRRRRPDVAFYIVGRSPPDSVRSLASDSVMVTGTVADVRPYLQFASVVVAPLRVARGIQNKILEAMAMGRPVVASESCVAALDPRVRGALLSAATAQEFAEEVEAVLAFPERAAVRGETARKTVLDHYSWAAHMAAIDPFLAPSGAFVDHATRAIK